MKLEKSKRQTAYKEQITTSVLKLFHLQSINNFTLNVLYVLGLLQTLLFSNNQLIQYNYYGQNIIQTPINQFWYIKLIARPDQIITTSDLLSQYGYLIPLILSLIFEITPILIFGFIRSSSTSKMHLYFQLSSIYFQVSLYFYIPFSGLCFNSFEYNDPDLVIKNFNQILSIITLIWLFFINLFRIMLCKESIDFQLNCFITLQLNFIDFVIWALNIFQLIVFYALSEFNEFVQALIIISYSLLNLINIFRLVTCKCKIINLTIVLMTYGLIQSTLLLINFKIDLRNMINILLYVLVPLLSYILIRLFQWYDCKITSIQGKNSIKQKKFIFSKFFNNEFTSREQSIMIYTNIISQYKLRKQIEPIPQYPLAFLNEECIPKYLMTYYHKLQLKLYVKELNKIESKYRNGNNYIHYASILFRLGLNNLALKQINMMLFHINPHNRSFAKESEPKIKSLTTLQVDVKSFSKSSKSQEVQEVAMHQINKTTKLLANTGTHGLSFFQKVKLNFLREKVRDKLRLSFKYRELANNSLDLQNGIDFFLKSEKRNQSLKDQIINLVNSKLQFFISLQQAKHIRSQQLFQVSKQLCLKIEILEQKINKLYTYFPSQRIQSLATYFQGELLDNYLDAYRITCNSSIQDDKLINVHNDTKYTFFNKDLIFLNIRFEDETQDLLIQNITPTICRFFNQNYEDLKTNSSIDCILPDAIRGEHILLVQRFFQSSKSKFYLKKNLSFFKTYKNIIKPCEFFFEINFSDTSQIQFLAFFSENYQSSAFLMVDVNCTLGGVTKNLFDKLNFTDFFLENLKSACLTNTPIEYLIPNFGNNVISNQLLTITEFRFLKQQVLFSQFPDESQRNVKNTFIEWQNSENILRCESLIHIHPCDIYGFQYYIIEIKELKFDDSFDERNSLDNAFSSISDSEALVNSPQILKVEKQKIELYGRNFKLFDIQDDKQYYYQRDSSKYEINLMSPADISLNPQILNSANPLLKLKQQEFYNQIGLMKDPAGSLQFSSIQKAIDLEDIEQGQVKKQEDTNSSSFAGVKKSQFYKKYEMMQQVIMPYYPRQLKKLISLLFLSFIVCSIHNIIIMTKNYGDLNQFISEIDMIELHSSFMAPHDIFVAMRIAIIAYNSYATDGVITTTQANKLTDPFYKNIYIGYSEIKEVFNKQLTNRNLQPFFENRTINMVFMGANTSDVYSVPLNIREALQQIIQNLFQYEYRYINRMSTSGSAIQVFGVGNQFHLHFWLEDLTLEILAYSKNRSLNITDEWTIIWVVFVVTSLFFSVGELYFYRIYYQRYDKYLNAFKYCNQNKLSYEIERYKIIQKQLQKDPDSIFVYKFDLFVKEQQLLTSAKIQDQISKLNKDQSRTSALQYENLSNVIGLSLILGIWIVYMGLSVIIYQGEVTYLNKYSDTIGIYKLIQDMTISSATLYQNRDYHYLWKNFTYLTTQDEVYIYSLIYSGINNIKKFNVLCSQFEAYKYQVSDDFVTFFTDIQRENVCELLGDEVMGFLSSFCPIAIQGNFESGVTAALNYISDNIQTQISVNNFTKRVEYPYYDNEAGIILVRVFQLMTSKLKQSLLTVAENLINITTVLSVIYIIFACISMLFLFFVLNKAYQKEYNLVKRFVQLLPNSVTLLDDQFERYIRIVLIDESE